MRKPLAVGVGLLLLLLLLLFSTTYTVKYNEVAIKATFGQTGPRSIVRDAGLHFRLPIFIDKVTKIDRRLQLVESPLEEITTRDGLQIVVRAFLLWRVDAESEAGPLDFFRSFGSVDGATPELRSQFRTAFTGALSRYAFNDLIGEGSRLELAETDIRNELARPLAAAGVDPVSVGISQVVVPPSTSMAVLKRMDATRQVLARAARTAGSAEAESIRSDARTDADKIRAFATQLAEEIRAEGEVQAAEYYERMAEDPDLASFLVWLDTLERVLHRNTTLFLPTLFEPFHLLDPTGVAAQAGIPLPPGDLEQGQPPVEVGAGEGDAPTPAGAGSTDGEPEHATTDPPGRTDALVEGGS